MFSYVRSNTTVRTYYEVSNVRTAAQIQAEQRHAATMTYGRPAGDRHNSVKPSSTCSRRLYYMKTSYVASTSCPQQSALLVVSCVQ